MRELTKSAVSSSWAISLFGAQQVADLFSCRQVGSLAARARSLDEVSDVVSSSLLNRSQQLYKLGDEAQRGMVDLTGAAIRFNMSGMIKPGFDVANPFVVGLAAVSPRRDWLLDWQELRNKIDIYDMVRNVERRLNVSDGAPIGELVERGYEYGDFHALWAIEGIGHYYGKQALGGDADPHGLLSNPEELNLPASSLTMLHAGIGLAFAEKLFKDVSAESATVLRERINEFVILCQNNSADGYLGAAYEALGLIIRTLYHGLLDATDRELQELGDEQLLGYFWHGAGRAIYFAPRNFLPCCRIDWATVADRAPHEIGRLNVIAGLAWAVILVNMRQPAIVAQLVQRFGETLISNDAFAFGVRSALLIRYDTTPRASYIDSFCSHSPEPRHSQENYWIRLIQEPCRTSIDIEYEQLRSLKQLDRLGRYLFPHERNPNG